MLYFIDKLIKYDINIKCKIAKRNMKIYNKKYFSEKCTISHRICFSRNKLKLYMIKYNGN